MKTNTVHNAQVLKWFIENGFFEKKIGFTKPQSLNLHLVSLQLLISYKKQTIKAKKKKQNYK